MDFEETILAGVIIIKPKTFFDDRGYFREQYHKHNYTQIGINADFVQDNFSRSSRGVIRGLHYQKRFPQGKLVSCLSGKILDVAVDIDPMSPTFRESVTVELTSVNGWQLWIPPGYAHGFSVLSDFADVSYKCTGFYDPSDEAGISWCDQGLAIDWIVEKPILSDKDAKLPSLVEV